MTTNTRKPRTRDWGRARKPIQAHEVTEPMLVHIRQSAQKSHLPQTVWPSRWYGKDFLGTDCLLTSMAVPSPGQMPHDADPGSQPLLTVLPPDYWPVWTDEDGIRWIARKDEYGDYTINEPLDPTGGAR